MNAKLTKRKPTRKWHWFIGPYPPTAFVALLEI